MSNRHTEVIVRHLLSAVCIVMFATLPVFAQDRDGDGLPDEIEYQLGSDVAFAEEFVTLHHDGVIGEDDRTVGRDHEKGPDIVDVDVANVAQDRWLFRISFAEDYVCEGNTLILYLDVDGDETTGRQDANIGTDLMYQHSGGNFGVGEKTPGLHKPPLRMLAHGKAVYVCTDLPLAEGKLPGQLRFAVLSHVSPPASSDSDSTGWLVADLPEVRDADKPRIGAPTPQAPVAALATDRPDGDGDGIPDDIERVLGMDPENADPLHLVHDDRSAADGDTLSSKWQKAPDMTKFYFGNVAQDRWVWRIDFADELDLSGSRVMLYVDVDNDITTGRRDGAPGTDVRLICDSGAFSTAIQNSAVLTRDREIRGYVDEQSLYFSMDLVMKHNENGDAEFRAYALSQTTVGEGDSDNTVWFTAVAGGSRDLPKRTVGVMSQFLSDGMIAQRRWLGWRAQLEELEVLALDPQEGRLTDMSLLRAAMEPTKPGASALFEAPEAGSFHVNALIQDSAQGLEEVSIRAGGAEVGRIVAGENDGDLYLFTTEKPVTLVRGAEIEFIAAAPAQDFRICEVFLSKAVPQEEALKITSLATWVTPRSLPGASTGDTVDVDVCFMTNRPVVAAVRWGEGGALDRESTEEVATFSHRVQLTGLARGGRYSVQAFAVEGRDEALSGTLAFVADQTRPERCSVERTSLPVTVADSMEAERPTWPVNSGVPIPRGELAGSEHCRLLDAQGQVVPAQFTGLGFWPDGSIKWLLVSFVHSGASPDYTLEYGQAVSTPAVTGGIAVEQTADGLVVQTDLLRAELSSAQFAPPGRVVVDANRDGQFSNDEVVVSGGEGLVLVDGEGKRYTSAGAGATRFEVEEAGPVRTVVRAEGPFAGPDGQFLKYRCRMYFYRGFAGIPTEVSLLAHEGKSGFPPTLNAVRSLTWPMESPTAAGAQPTRWVQDDIDRYVRYGAAEPQVGEGQGPGVATVAHNGADFTVTIRDFWQQYPNGFSLDGSTLTAELFPELPADVYAEHTDPKLLTMNYYWFRDGNYLVASGTEPTTDVLLYFGAPTDDERVAEAWQQPVQLTPGQEAICASGAFMDLAPSHEGRFEAYDQYMRTGLDNLERTRVRQREYSWMNYGDTYGERVVNWTNQEYDMQWGLLVNYARTGDMAYLDRALEAALHTVEIDMINWSDDPEVLGIQKEHAPWHVGGYDTPQPENTLYWFKNGIWNTGHVWTQGTYMAWCLTGERRYYESIERLSEFLDRSRTQFQERWVHRNYGWLTIAALGAYHTNAHPFHLNAARFYVQNVVDRQDPGSGGLIHPIGECEHEIRHMGGKSFMTGVVMAGVTMLDYVEPRDDLKRSLILSADWEYARMWNEEKNGFRYAQCPQYDDYASAPSMECWGLARAAELSGKPEHREMFLRSLSKMIHESGPSGSGKGYATQIRMTPYAVSALQRWGFDEVPASAPSKPVVSAPGQVYLIPGQPLTLSLAVGYSSPTPLDATAEIVKLPDGLTAGQTKVEWQMQRNVAAGPTFSLTGNARTGENIVVCWQAGEWSGEVQSVVRERQALDLGDGIGYIGGEDDPVGLALKALGIELEPVADLTPATLARYSALLVGREAHEKNYAGLRDHAAALLDFLQAGGSVALIQLQDSSWQGSWLPAPLTLSNNTGQAGEIVAPEHPLFTTPNRLTSVAGIISYDTMPVAGEGWNVLATDDKGQPSIVTMDAGEGWVLVVQPSPDRYVVGQEFAAPPLTTDTCASLIENIVAWLQSPM